MQSSLENSLAVFFKFRTNFAIGASPKPPAKLQLAYRRERLLGSQKLWQTAASNIPSNPMNSGENCIPSRAMVQQNVGLPFPAKGVFRLTKDHLAGDVTYL
jgi:hypothetical protein